MNMREHENRDAKVTAYVALRTEPGLWTVGFYSPDGKFNPSQDFANLSDAERHVHYLNGGRE